MLGFTALSETPISSLADTAATVGYRSFFWWMGGVYNPAPSVHRRHGGVWDFTEADKAERERHKKEKQSEDELRRIIDSAFRKANGEEEHTVQPVVQSKAQRKALAKSVLADVRLDGFDTTLEQIQNLIRDYERLRLIKAMEDEAVAILLLM